jgi:outer membrane receptor protein involved in Fe transport
MRVNAYEVGTKNTFLDHTLTLNLTGFYYEVTGRLRPTRELRNEVQHERP